MDNHYIIDEWSVIENGFDPAWQEASESIFSLGNGHMGQRANPEERYSGETLQGTYIAGIYYPDKTRVGWWKNGYPEYFAKVPNAPSWISISVRVDGEELDLHTCHVLEFRRELNMRHGYLERDFTVEFHSGKQIQVNARRFLSMAEDEIGAIRYAIRALNFSGNIELFSFIEGNIKNRDSNYDEKFWDVIETGSDQEKAFVHARTRKTLFEACFTMKTEVIHGGSPSGIMIQPVSSLTMAGHKMSFSIMSHDSVVLYKYVSGPPSLASVVALIRL